MRSLLLVIHYKWVPINIVDYLMSVKDERPECNWAHFLCSFLVALLDPLCITETKVSQGGVNLARNDGITDVEMNKFFPFRAYFLAHGGLLAFDISHRVLSSSDLKQL